MKRLLREHLFDLQRSDIGAISTAAQGLDTAHPCNDRDMPCHLATSEDRSIGADDCEAGNCPPIRDSPLDLGRAVSNGNAVPPFLQQFVQPQLPQQSRGMSRALSPEPVTKKPIASRLQAPPNDVESRSFVDFCSCLFCPCKIVFVRRTRKRAPTEAAPSSIPTTAVDQLDPRNAAREPELLRVRRKSSKADRRRRKPRRASQLAGSVLGSSDTPQRRRSSTTITSSEFERIMRSASVHGAAPTECYELEDTRSAAGQAETKIQQPTNIAAEHSTPPGPSDPPPGSGSVISPGNVEAEREMAQRARRHNASMPEAVRKGPSLGSFIKMRKSKTSDFRETVERSPDRAARTEEARMIGREGSTSKPGATAMLDSADEPDGPQTKSWGADEPGTVAQGPFFGSPLSSVEADLQEVPQSATQHDTTSESEHRCTSRKSSVSSQSSMRRNKMKETFQNQPNRGFVILRESDRDRLRSITPSRPSRSTPSAEKGAGTETAAAQLETRTEPMTSHIVQKEYSAPEPMIGYYAPWFSPGPGASPVPRPTDSAEPSSAQTPHPQSRYPGYGLLQRPQIGDHIAGMLGYAAPPLTFPTPGFLSQYEPPLPYPRIPPAPASDLNNVLPLPWHMPAQRLSRRGEEEGFRTSPEPQPQDEISDEAAERILQRLAERWIVAGGHESEREA